MVGSRAVVVVLAALTLGYGGALVIASGPAPLAATAHAHPEPGDVDGDSVRDELDNCPTIPNGSQLNTDGDVPPVGDACDPDDDNDEVPDSTDNCRVVANPDQLDSDGDGRGDACPPQHSDTDGISDEDDNCDLHPNPDQRDTDGDDKGDACDRDDDNDRYDDGFDNCPVVYNPDQADLDRDGLGSACDGQELIAGPTAVPAGGGAPGTGPGTAAAPADATPPKLTVSVQRRQRLRDSGTALVVKASCSEACSLRAEVSASSSAARKVRLGTTRIVLARGSWSLAGAGQTYVFARWTPTARRLRAGRRLQSALRVTATDPAGNRHAVTKRIDLRR